MKKLFGIPYYHTSIDENCFDKKTIVETIEHNFKISEYRNKWCIGGAKIHHSHGDEDSVNFKKVNYESLINVYKKEIETYLKEFNFDFDWNYKFQIVNYNASNSIGDFMKDHNHTDSHFSATHYLQFNTDHNPTQFRSPHNSAPFNEVIYKNLFSLFKFNDAERFKNEDLQWLRPHLQLETKENDFIIVPSIMEHSIPPVVKVSDKIRIVLALNITLSRR